MNYIINIKTRDIIVGGAVVLFVASKVEKKITKIMKKAKREKEILKKAAEDCIECAHDCSDEYTYCPCCGKKIKED